ncbi:MAG: hypothetical protein V4541_12720 [Bacteroidota bacterium]
MAVLHHKEEKIQAVLGRLPKKYTQEQFVAQFIKLFSKDWGKIKSAYIKQSQDKEPGTVILMPKPDLYLQQILTTFLQKEAAIVIIEKEKPAKKVIAVKTPVEKTAPAKIKKAKVIKQKEVIQPEEATVKIKKAKAPVKK